MMNALETLLEYVKFTSTFTLLSFSASAWLVSKEIEKFGKLQWYQISIALSFLGSCVSGGYLAHTIKLAFIEAARGEKGNVVSDPIQDSLFYGQLGLYVAVFFLALYVVLFAKYRGKK